MWSNCLLDLGTTSSLVTWSLYEMCSILRQHLISMACHLLWSSSVRVHDSQAYRKMDVTRERISGIFLFFACKLAMFGHVTRHDSLSKTILRGTQGVGRRRCRHRKCWTDNIKEWTSLPIYIYIYIYIEREREREGERERERELNKDLLPKRLN